MIKMSELAKTEVKNRAKAMTEEQKYITLACFDSNRLIEALNRRDELCTMMLNNILDIVSAVPYDAILSEKERALKEIKGVLNGKNENVSQS